MKKSERKKERAKAKEEDVEMNTVAMERKNTTTTTTHSTHTIKTKQTRKASKKSLHSQRQYHCFYIQKNALMHNSRDIFAIKCAAGSKYTFY